MPEMDETGLLTRMRADAIFSNGEAPENSRCAYSTENNTMNALVVDGRPSRQRDQEGDKNQAE
jgi:hypothetical protein